MAAYRSVLCAIELDESNGQVVERAAAIARDSKARLTLLHVIEHFPEDRSNELIAPEDEDPKKYERKRVLEDLAAVAGKSGIGDAEYEVRFTSSSAGEEIADFASGGSYDLVVVGSHHRHGLAAFLLSTSEGVVHRASCDVLVVHTG
jgi:universal stress protein A